MRLLWLGASEIFPRGLPEAALAQNIAANAIRSATGEDVEVVERRIWPGPAMVTAAGRWLGTYEPELVYVWVSSFPACYPSVAIRLEKAWGRFGQRLGDIGAAAAGDGWLPRAPVFGAARWLARRSIGASTYFEPEEVVTAFDALFRAVLRHEQIGLVVAQSPRPVYLDTGRRIADARWRRQSDGIARICDDLHIPCLDLDTGNTDEDILALRGDDRLHFNEPGHALYGKLAGEALARAWGAARS